MVALSKPSKALFIAGALAALVRVTQGPKKSGQIGFNLAIASSCLPPWFLAMFGRLYTESGTEEQKEEKRARFAKVLITFTAVCWRMALASSFWVKLEIEGVGSFRKNFGNTGKPMCYIANHTSFFDIFLAVTTLPLSKVGKVKMIVSSHVLDMPIIGRITRGMGHLAVPFKDTSSASTTFEVDKDALAIVMQKYENHLKKGECCAWFPEGQVHKGDCSKLQLFRAGGLGIAVRNDVEMWSMTTVGNAVVWPGGAPVGGNPARVGGKVECICTSSKDFFSAPETGSNEREQSIHLADYTSKKMQDIIDGFVAKGFKAGDNTKKKKKTEDASGEKKAD